MRRILVLAALLLLLGSTAVAEVKNTSHNLSLTGPSSTQTGSDEICIHCHTPHNSRIAQPLWNHSLSKATNYTYYTSDTTESETNDNPDVSGATGGSSRLCMSCHDGTVALNTLINDPQDANAATSGADVKLVSGDVGYLGVNLTNDHPVGIDYSAVMLADSDPEGGLKPTVDTTYGVQLFGGNVECASCHDPHTDVADRDPFLVNANVDSVICSSCHTK